MIYNIHIQQGRRHTDILPRGGGGGADLLPIALLLQWLGLPAMSVNVLLLESPKPTGRSHCLTVIQRQGGKYIFLGP